MSEKHFPEKKENSACTLINFDLMKLLQRLFAFYINSSIHVALAVSALTAITVLEFRLVVPFAFWIFVFSVTALGYNFVKYAKIAGLDYRRLTGSLKAIQIFSVGCFVLLLYSVVFLPLGVVLMTAGFAVPTFLYAVPLLRHKNLRNFTGVKIFIVALVWAGISVLVPLTAAGHGFSNETGLAFAQRAIIVVVLILPFEIRDIPYDDLTLRTLPQQIGVVGTKILGIGLLLLCVMLRFFRDVDQFGHVVVFWVFVIVLGGMLMVSRPAQSRYFASFWVEGLPILWWVLLISNEVFQGFG